jgi:hypothetical protein
MARTASRHLHAPRASRAPSRLNPLPQEAPIATLFDPHFQATYLGLPVSGAKLNFYRAGTTSRITSYQNSTATTPHTNPVVADASGMFPAIFLAQVAPFKIVLTTALGTTLQSIDNIPVGDVIDLETIEQAVIEVEELRDETAAILAATVVAGTTAVTSINTATTTGLASIDDALEEVDVLVTAAETAETNAETAETNAETALALTLIARGDAQSAAEASGDVVFYDTKAAATAALGGLADQQIVEVFNDEAEGGARTRYRVETGALVFKTVAGMDVEDTFVPTFTGGTPSLIRGVMEREVQGLGTNRATDNTTVLEEAWDRATGIVYDSIAGELAFMDMANYDMKLPPGKFLYTGGGLDWITRAPIVLTGASNWATEIVLPDDVYFMDLDGYITGIEVRGIKFTGGKGAYRSTTAANNVSGRRVFRDNIFSLYTECAINENGTDSPNFEASGNIFVGKGGEPTLGIALSGYTDISVIRHNMLLRNKINLKFQAGIRAGQDDLGPAPNTYIGENDMTRFVGDDTPTVKVADIWIEPNPETAANAGVGLTIANQKFGNENYTAGQYKILVADVDRTVGEADNNGAQHTHKTTKSDGYVSMLKVENCVFQYSGDNYEEPAPLYSFTRRLDGLDWGSGNKITGAEPIMRAVQYDAIAAVDGVRGAATSLIHVGPSENDSTRRAKITNGPAFVVDPNAQAQSSRLIPRYNNAGMDDGAIVLLVSDTISGATLSNATLSATTDSLGGSNATEITFSDQNGFATLTLDSSILLDNMAVWAEIDVLVGGTLPLPGLQIGIRSSGGVFQASRAFEPPAFWRTFVVPWFKPDPSGSWRFDMRPAAGDYSAGVATKVKIGRPRVYQADNAVNFGNIRTYGTGRWDGGHVRTKNWSFFVDASSRPRLKVSTVDPTSDTDGSILKNYLSGATGSRPATGNFVGREYYDTTLGKPIYWNGANWSDAAGASGV